MDLGDQRETLLHVGRAVQRVVTRAEHRGQRVGVVGAAGDGFRVGAQRETVITITGEVQLGGEAHQDPGSERRRLRQLGERLLEQRHEALVDRAALVSLVDQHASEPQYRVREPLGAPRGAGCGHGLEQHRVRRARVATVILRVAQRREEARDVVEVVAAVPRESERVREPVHGFVVRADRLGAFAGANRELDRVAGAADVCRRGEVVCEVGGEPIDVVVVIRLDGFRDPLVQLCAPGGAETVEQHLAHERMVEPQAPRCRWTTRRARPPAGPPRPRSCRSGSGSPQARATTPSSIEPPMTAPTSSTRRADEPSRATFASISSVSPRGNPIVSNSGPSAAGEGRPATAR